MTTTTINMGNNEHLTIGVIEANGKFLALTLCASKSFKTRAGAEKWMRARGYNADGTRI